MWLILFIRKQGLDSLEIWDQRSLNWSELTHLKHVFSQNGSVNCSTNGRLTPLEKTRNSEPLLNNFSLKISKWIIDVCFLQFNVQQTSCRMRKFLFAKDVREELEDIPQTKMTCETKKLFNCKSFWKKDRFQSYTDRDLCLERKYASSLISLYFKTSKQFADI